MYHLVFSLLACLSLPMSKSLSLFFSPSITLTQLSFSPSPLSPLKFLSCFSLSHPFSTNLLNSPVCICSAGPPLPPSHILSSSCIVNMERQCSVVFNIYSASIEGSTNQYINIRLLFKKNRLCQVSVVSHMMDARKFDRWFRDPISGDGGVVSEAERHCWISEKRLTGERRGGKRDGKWISGGVFLCCHSECATSVEPHEHLHVST